MAKKTLAQWIQEALSDPDKPNPISMLSLVHMVGSQYNEIHSVKFGPGNFPTATDLAKMLRGKAETDAQELPGVQTYNLLAFYGTPEPQARFPFLVNQQADPMSSGLATEAPTATGEKQMGMRWAEFVLQQTYRRQQSLDDHSIRVIEKQSTMIDNLLTENRDIFEIFKEMMLEKVKEDREYQMKMAEHKRSTDERKKWISFAPALVNNILGREVFPTSSEDTALIEAIAESITEEQIGMLEHIVPPELAGPLASRFTRHMVKINEDKKTEQALTTVTPKDDEMVETH